MQDIEGGVAAPGTPPAWPALLKTAISGRPLSPASPLMVACVTFAVMGRTARPEGTSAVTFVPHVPHQGGAGEGGSCLVAVS
jgi:hypothetical protein